MKPSKYNIISKNPENEDTILFNTMYGSTVIIDTKTLPIVEKILNYPNSAHTQKELEVLNSLIEGKYIIDDNVDELTILESRKKAGMKDKNRADVIIMPNLDCNFACPYCYEKHDLKNRISNEKEISIKLWLENLIDNGKFKIILLNWFGGEPLLSYRSILSIGKHVLDKCSKKGVSLLTHITTNGYALTEDIINELLNIKIFNYQITVDGPPEIHNKTRFLKNGRGSFERVFSNIINLAKATNEVKISLRINYNHNNIKFIPELLSLFPNNIRYQLRVVYEPIFGNSNLSATKNISAEEISSTITKYYELAESMGFDVVLGGLGVGKLVYCYAERENQFIINYNGDVFKCSVSDFSSSERVGFINNKGKFIIDEKNWNSWFEMELFNEKCRMCIFLPLCMGGCRKDRLENMTTGNYCSLVPTNTSYALKSIAFGSFNEIIKKEVEISRNCGKTKQSNY